MGEFKCDCCGGTFEKAWEDEEAEKEFEKTFGRAIVQSDGLVCDDCYQKIMGGLRN